MGTLNVHETVQNRKISMLKLGPKFHEISQKNIGPLTYPLKSLQGGAP